MDLLLPSVANFYVTLILLGNLIRKENVESIGKELHQNHALGVMVASSETDHHYEELPCRDFRSGTAPSGSFHRPKVLDNRALVGIYSSPLYAEPSRSRRQTDTMSTSPHRHSFEGKCVEYILILASSMFSGYSRWS